MKKAILVLFVGVFTILANTSFANTTDFNDIYNIDVQVDISDESSAIAKELAMQKANRTAFTTVIHKITDAEGFEILNALDDDQILNFIKEVSIKSEKSSNVRYIASLNILINDELLRQYMDEKEINYAVINAKNIIIIPTFREFKTDTPMLWEAKNLWKKAWDEEAKNNNNVVNFVSLPATGSNYASMDSGKAINLDQTAMKQISFNNNTSTIFVVDAVYNGIEGLTINIISNPDGNIETIEISGDRSPQLFIDSIIETKKSIIENLKKQIIEEKTMKNELNVLYKYSSMSDWIKLEKEVKKISYVEELKITAMSNGTVQFKIIFSGGYDRLNEELNKKYLKITEEDEQFIIHKL